ncbi:MAG: aminotransferase class I/II-fold pyridoxal phosphate-dependent enzyme [Rhodospirillaceae bacterium]|nr:aminotransferase class I/II-fold pyridoxal phosphate-dependent enzyme [Rhodospirillaceae bacterium]
MTLKASRRGAVPPFIVMDVMRDAAMLEAAGRSIVHLEVGQPSTGLPQAAAAAVGALIGRDPLGYTVADGLMNLRERIARHYADMYCVRVDPARIVVTTGSSAAFTLAFLAAFEAGDRVVVAAPGYPSYRHILSAYGICPELVPVDASTRFNVTVDHLRKMNPAPDGVILASPANPTGSMVEPAAFKELCAYCEAHGIRLISDEIYHGITFGMTALTAADLAPSALVINSFSKFFSMTGWRVGWMIVPEDLCRSVECLAQNLYISPPALSQHAALAAFAGLDELKANVATYARNRATLLRTLPRLGFENFSPPDGAFYFYVNVAHLGADSPEVCRRILHEAGVAVTPGLDFDPFHGKEWMRLSYAVSEAQVAEAVTRLEAWIKTRKP